MDLLTSTQGTRGIRRRWGGDDASVARVPSSCRWLFKNLHLGNYPHSPVVPKWRIGFWNRAMALGWLQNTRVKAVNIPGSSTVVAQKRIANTSRYPSKPGDCLHKRQQQILLWLLCWVFFCLFSLNCQVSIFRTACIQIFLVCGSPVTPVCSSGSFIRTDPHWRLFSVDDVVLLSSWLVFHRI